MVPDEFLPSAYHHMSISVEVQNASKLKGAELVQIYVAYPETKRKRPKKELKAFARISLDPGKKHE